MLSYFPGAQRRDCVYPLGRSESWPVSDVRMTTRTPPRPAASSSILLLRRVHVGIEALEPIGSAEPDRVVRRP